MADQHEHERGIRPNEQRPEVEDERDESEDRERKHENPKPRSAPRFGSAGSGGLEYEPGPERD